MDQDEYDEEYTEDHMVLNVDGSRDDTNPNYMEGFINGNRLKLLTVTGSPVTILALDEAKKIMKRDKLHVPDMKEKDM